MSFLLRLCVILLCFTTKVFSATLPNILPDLVYYDADSIKITQNMNTFEFDGNAMFMMGDLFLTADKIVVQKAENLVTADGHVKIIYKKTQATASKITYDANTKEMVMSQAKIYSNPKLTDDLLTREALGITPAEIAFEKARVQRTTEIVTELKNVRASYVNLKNLASIKKDDKNIQTQLEQLQKKYGELLERYKRITNQPNLPFSSLPENEQKKYLERRSALDTFNRDHPDMAENILNFSEMPSYIAISASQITQKDNDTYLLNDTFLTPCNCGTSGIPPIFGFSAQKAKLDVGNYVTMEGATLDIFSLPVFYLPWSILSVKSKRETGFLYPSFYTSNNAGGVVIVPFYLTLGEHADSTTQFEYFSQRGIRLDENVRVSFLENSMLNLGGSAAFDKTYSQDWATNKQHIETALQHTTDPTKIEQLNSFIGPDLTTRWFAETSLNLPISERTSFKFNGQIPSDNNYLSDFAPSTNVDPISTVYGNTTPSSVRFLNQEVDGEYYGDNIVFSMRAGRYQDLFALTQNSTSVSLPLFEFTILPAYYWYLPFVFSNKTTFENVAGALTIKGRRLASSAYVTFNLPSNSYLNSYLQIQETFVQYESATENASSTAVANPYELYTRFSMRTELPMYTVASFKNKTAHTETFIQNNFKPYLELAYIPGVTRSESFPYTYQLWYADDNVAKQALITVGAEWSLNFKRQSDATKNKRIVDQVDSKIADENILEEVLKSQKNTAGQSPQAPSDMLIIPTDTQQATQIYTQWAALELDRFYAQVLKSEFNRDDFLINTNPYSLRTDYDFTPFRLKIYTNTNLIAKQTANELNRIAGPDFSPLYLPERLGDITTEFNWNFLPFIAWDGTVVYSYSQAYGRMNTLTTSSNIGLGWGFAGMFRYQILYNVDPLRPEGFVRKTFLNYGASYMPKPFVKIGFEWAKNVDPTTPASTDLSHGRKYGSSYYIKFLNIQDCFDIFVARNKTAGVPENEATYAVGLNFNFFGHNIQFNQLGPFVTNQLN